MNVVFWCLLTLMNLHISMKSIMVHAGVMNILKSGRVPQGWLSTFVNFWATDKYSVSICICFLINPWIGKGSWKMIRSNYVNFRVCDISICMYLKNLMVWWKLFMDTILGARKILHRSGKAPAWVALYSNCIWMCHTI